MQLLLHVPRRRRRSTRYGQHNPAAISSSRFFSSFTIHKNFYVFKAAAAVVKANSSNGGDHSTTNTNAQQQQLPKKKKKQSVPQQQKKLNRLPLANAAGNAIATAAGATTAAVLQHAHGDGGGVKNVAGNRIHYNWALAKPVWLFLFFFWIICTICYFIRQRNSWTHMLLLLRPHNRPIEWAAWLLLLLLLHNESCALSGFIPQIHHSSTYIYLFLLSHTPTHQFIKSHLKMIKNSQHKHLFFSLWKNISSAHHSYHKPSLKSAFTIFRLDKKRMNYNLKDFV